MSNVVRITPATTAIAQTLNISLAGEQVVLHIAGTRCTKSIYKQLPHQSLIDKNGNLNGIAYGKINHHLHAECGHAVPESHLHVIWVIDNTIYRDTIWIDNLKLNGNYPAYHPNYSEARRKYEHVRAYDTDFYRWVYKYKLTGGRKFGKLPLEQQQELRKRHNSRKRPEFMEWYKKNYHKGYLEEQQHQIEYGTIQTKWNGTAQSLRDLPQLFIGA